MKKNKTGDGEEREKMAVESSSLNSLKTSTLSLSPPLHRRRQRHRHRHRLVDRQGRLRRGGRAEGGLPVGESFLSSTTISSMPQLSLSLFHRRRNAPLQALSMHIYVDDDSRRRPLRSFKLKSRIKQSVGQIPSSSASAKSGSKKSSSSAGGDGGDDGGDKRTLLAGSDALGFRRDDMEVSDKELMVTRDRLS